MLVYDSFEAHVTDTVKASFKRKHTDLAVTPGGLTSLLQPLDGSLNKPFKDGVRKEWMADGIHEFTAPGGQRRVVSSCTGTQRKETLTNCVITPCMVMKTKGIPSCTGTPGQPQKKASEELTKILITKRVGM